MKKNSSSETAEQQEREELTGWILACVILIAFMIPYGIVNHLPLHRTVEPFILGENLIPFLPWTFFIYLSAYLQGALVIKSMPKKHLMHALKVSAIMISIALVSFILFPIAYPRGLYADSNALVSFFRITDGPGNCFPSLHVAFTILFSVCYQLYGKSRWKKAGMWLWTAAIIVSVLTTKQHYLIDVFGAIALSIPCMLYLKKGYYSIR